MHEVLYDSPPAWIMWIKLPNAMTPRNPVNGGSHNGGHGPPSSKMKPSIASLVKFGRRSWHGMCVTHMGCANTNVLPMANFGKMEGHRNANRFLADTFGSFIQFSTPK